MDKKFTVDFIVHILEGQGKEYKGKMPDVSDITVKKIIGWYNKNGYYGDLPFEKPRITHVKDNKFRLHSKFIPKNIDSFEDTIIKIERYVDFDDDVIIP